MKKIKRFIFSIIIAIVILGYLFYKSDIRILPNIIKQISLKGILLAFCVYFLSIISKTVRFYILLDKKIEFSDMFGITCIHNMFNNILPARTGELSYIFFIRKYKNITLGKNIFSLFIARFFDILVILLFFLFAIIFIKNLPDKMDTIVPYVSVIFAICLLIFISILLFNSAYMKFVDFISKMWIFRKSKLIKPVIKNIKEILSNFSLLKKENFFIKIILLTILVWLFQYLFYFFLINDLGVSLSFEEIVIGLIFLIAITVLPIQGIIGFGTTEAAITSALMLFGIPYNEAFAVSLLTHVINIIFFLLFGLIGYILILKKYNRET